MFQLSLSRGPMRRYRILLYLTAAVVLLGLYNSYLYSVGFEKPTKSSYSPNIEDLENVNFRVPIHLDITRITPKPTIPSNEMPRPLIRVQSFARAQALTPEFLLPDSVASNRSLMIPVLERINDDQVVLNADVYNTTEFVILIQVHDRLEYLELLIRSLQRSAGIDRSLLIFSHDVYNASINRLVRSITFCKVMQIFFPVSLQLYPNVFPGFDPRDCTRNTPKLEAHRRKCPNADWHDSYGHYRDPQLCQIKHHWFWKANFVFEKVRSIKDFNGLFLFLEEDHYVVEDFLHMVNLMEKTRLKQYPSVSILCLGTYDKKPNYSSASNRIQVGYWISSLHNMGMAIRRTLWDQIKAATKTFCEFDEYNWDYSLMYLSQSKRFGEPLKAMVMKHSPRVYHIGECGVHHKKKKTCSPTAIVLKIDKSLERVVLNLYPSTLRYIGVTMGRLRKFKGNGGWGDLRDRRLCKSFVDEPSPATEEKRLTL